jgi:hypothetical protein
MALGSLVSTVNRLNIEQQKNLGSISRRNVKNQERVELYLQKKTKAHMQL